MRIFSEIDVFIASCSFEDRCLSIAQHLQGQKVKNALVVKSLNVHERSLVNARLMKDLMPTAKIVTTDYNNPVAFAEEIYSALVEILTQSSSTQQNIIVDISTFTREFLLILFNLLRYITNTESRVLFLYSDVSRYSINEKHENIWLSKGIKDVRSVLGFPGEMSPAKRTHLLVLGGFEQERTLKLVELFEPAIFSLGYGPVQSSITIEHSQNNLMFNNKIISVRQNADVFEFPPNDPHGTSISIENQMKKYVGYNVVVAPMNTKLSTVGAGLAALRHDEIQLCYAQPEVYNVDGYSLPGKSFFLFDPGALHDI